MQSTPSPIRLAFVAALAAFALGACSGGGGSGGGTPATGGASNPFPTTTGKEIAQGCCLQDGSRPSPTQSLPAGLKLADFQALPGVPYSEFALTGRPDKTVGGIPVHTDTSDSVTDEDGKTYSAVAYRSVLEHGEMLLSTRLDSSAPAASTASAGTSNTGRRAVHQHILFGTPTPASADISEVSGTWSGIAIGREEHDGDVPASVDHASDMVVEGEVGIAMSTGGGSGTRINVDFTDWEGYPDAAFRNVEVTQEGNSYGFDLGSPEGSDWAAATGEGSFYGDQFQEIMGTGEFQTATGGRTLNVVYGAKKAPPMGDISDFLPYDYLRDPFQNIILFFGNATGGPFHEEDQPAWALETLIREYATDGTDFPQFNVFEFGLPANANGIPLQKTAKMQADRYSAIAYQAVLEHSMLLFQRGIYPFGPGPFAPGVNTDNKKSGSFGFTTGSTPSIGAVAGTWKGKSIGHVWDGDFRDNWPDPVTLADIAIVERSIIQGDVEIGVTLDGDNSKIRWEFGNWIGGSGDYPTYKHEALILDNRHSSVRPIAVDTCAYENSYQRCGLDTHIFHFASSGPEGNPEPWLNTALRFQFNGPNREEVSGFFNLGSNEEVDVYLRGVFAAKKQP